MASWIHCNKCFQQPEKSKNEKFFLTECGHVLCGKCTHQMRTCVMCNTNTSIMQICKEMNPSYRCFFDSPNVCMERGLEILAFQNCQREALLTNFQNKYLYARQECMKQYYKNNKLLQEIKRLHSLLRKSNGPPNQPSASTPAGCSSFNSFQNMTIGSISPKPKTTFQFGNAHKHDRPIFTPVSAVPGVAQRLSTSKHSNSSQSFQSVRASPVQPPPPTKGGNGFVPIHRSSLDALSSMNAQNNGFHNPMRRFNTMRRT